MPPKKTAKPATDWVALLKTGAAGVKKWNRLTTAERVAVKLAGADLSGCDLTGINLSGVAAQGASFANCVLTDARLHGVSSASVPTSFDRASFAGATLTRANLSSAGFDDT